MLYFHGCCKQQKNNLETYTLTLLCLQVFYVSITYQQHSKETYIIHKCRCYFRFGILNFSVSQNSWGWQGPRKAIWAIPPAQGPPEQGAQHHVQVAFEDP